MKKYFHWSKKRKPYFEGWYVKHQHDGRTLACIPAFHVDERGEKTASIQIITDEGAWNITFPGSKFKAEKEKFKVRIGENIFSEKGMYLKLNSHNLSIEGTVKYGAFHKIHGEIMGPFQYAPFMECNHGVVSMSHSLCGELMVNGERIDFTKGHGYIETDWGSSFPKDYLWSQCSFGKSLRDSIMISAADIPFLGRCFKGCIGIIYYQGREYRIATYLGAVIRKYNDDEVWIKQKNAEIRVTRLGECAFGLRAPLRGDMSRTIYESPACEVRYQFFIKGRQVFDLISSEASFEKAETDSSR